MIFVAEIQQCTSTASLDLLNLGTIPYGALYKGSRKAAKASPRTTPGGTSRWNSTSARPQQKILRQMETNGLVVTKGDTGDGRQRIIAPTAKARDLQTAVRAYIDGQQKAMKR